MLKNNSAITMGKTKKPAAAAKRGRGAAAKTTKTSKAPASVCPYARAEFNIEGSDEEPRWVGYHKEKMYAGAHPARSAPACGELLQFKVPRKWLDIDAKNFEYYTFCFVLHLKKKDKNKSGADDRVGTRTEVINGDGELVDLIREHFRGRLVRTSEPVETTWVGRGDASRVRIACRRRPRQNWKYQIKFLEASLQLGADGTVPESEFGPGPGEGSDDDLSSEDTYGQRLSPESAKRRRARGIYYK